MPDYFHFYYDQSGIKVLGMTFMSFNFRCVQLGIPCPYLNYSHYNIFIASGENRHIPSMTFLTRLKYPLKDALHPECAQFYPAVIE